MKVGWYKMFILFVTLVLLGFGKLYAQDTISVASCKGKYSVDSLMTGVWKCYHANGKLAVRGKLIPNLIEHYSHEFDSLGTIIKTDTTMAEQKVGLWKCYDYSGNKTFVYRLDKENRLEFIHSYYNGVISGKNKYKDGQKTCSVSFYPNGRLKSKTYTYKNHGCKWIRWDEKGKKEKGRCAENVHSN